MENLQELLDDVKHILEKSKIEKDEAYKRGELFNIFNVLNLTADETRTHSAFIAELLNPDGSHGLGDQFLRSFIRATDCLGSWEFDTRSAEVHTEWSIGGKNDDCAEGGRLDIIIEFKGKAIIIENKIYAGDQEKQLMRYYNYGRRNYPGGFRLLYLTLNGNDASKDSRGEKLTLGEDYYAISYKHEISDWLKRCIELAARHPLIRETLIQYKHLIDQLTMNDMDRNSQDELLKVMTDPKNIDSIRSIINLGAKWKERIFSLYVLTPLKEKFNDEWDIKIGNKGITVKHVNWTQYWISIDWGKKMGKNVSIGITTNKPGAKKIQIMDCLSGRGSHTPREGEEWWPYGWKWMDEKYWDVTQMVDGNLVEYLYQYINNILKEIDEKQLPM